MGRPETIIIFLMARLYDADDSRELAAIHNLAFPDNQYSPSDFAEYVNGTRAYGGEVWVLEDGSVAGYAAVSPVPGLPTITELDGCIAPARRRQGLGTRLWRGVRDHLQGSNIKQVAYGVQCLQSSAALFLQKQGFFVEHEEWVLVFDDWENWQQLPHLDNLQVQTFSRKTAVSLFCDLYEQCFTGLPWDQPYSQKEVVNTLIQAADLQFLIVEGRTIGFAWTKLDSQGSGIIEPVGILPAYQNQGFGRQLLSLAMRSLKKRGARRIEIGAWRDNQRAIALYHSLGFRQVKTITYLAYNVNE